jgi:nitroreductase
MRILDLSPDELLATTRSVRKRLDLTRPVNTAVIRECLELALQAPTSSNSQGWHFVVVTDPEPRHGLATIYRKGFERYKELVIPVLQKQAASSEQEARAVARMLNSGQYLTDHLHEVPVHVIPCIQGRTDQQPIITQAARWGSIMPAAWSFILAARSRGLGSSLTSLHLFFEQAAAELLHIPFEQVMQAGLIPVAYTLGTDFKPAARKPLESVLHWDTW